MRTVDVEQFCSWSACRISSCFSACTIVGRHRVRLRRHREHHREEVLDEVELVVGVQERLADRLLVRVGRDRRDLRHEPQDRQLHLLGVMRVVAVLVEGRQRAHHARQDRHRVGVLREAVEEALHVLVQERVAADAEAELVELVARRELAVDQEVRRLEVRRGVALDELLDRDAAVAQDPLVAVDVGDRRLAGAGVHVAVVERDDAGLRAQLGDVGAELVLGATHDRELDLRVSVPEVRGLLVGHGGAPSLRVGSNLPTGPCIDRRGVRLRSDSCPAPMDFDLSEDQLALRDGARALLDDLAPTTRVRAVAETPTRVDRGPLDRDGGAGLARDRGPRGRRWGGPRRSRARGAAGGDRPPRRARAVPPDRSRASTSSLVSATPTRSARCSVGSGVACIAWSKRSDAVHAEADGDGWRLSGRPDPVPFASVADVALVIAQDGDGAALFAVDLDDSTRPPAEPAMDLTRPVAWLHFERTSAAPARWSGAGRRAARPRRDGDARSSCSVARRCALDLAVDYAKERVQFGRPIGSFQAVKHRCADMLVDVEGMRSTAYWAAWCLEADDPDQSIAASTAKTWAVGRVEAGDGRGAPGARRHRLHVGARPAPLHEAGAARPADASATRSYHRTRLASLLRPKVEAGESVV